MNRFRMRALVLLVGLGACGLEHDNIVDPEHEGTLSIAGPAVLPAGTTARYRVTSSTSGESDVPFLFTSDNSTRLRFDVAGTATAISPGAVTIRAHYFDIILTTTVTVQ